MNPLLKSGCSSRKTPHLERRPRRRFRFDAALPMLEARQLLAAGGLGINLDNSLGFVDLMKDSRNWSPIGASTLPLDSNGWPEANASIVAFDNRVNQPWNGPDPNAATPNIGGTYHLSFTGSATIGADWPGNFTVQNQTYNSSTNTTTADLVVPQNANAIMIMDFTNTVNSASPPGPAGPT